MNEGLKNFLYGIVNWVLNLFIFLSFLLLAYISWWAVYASFVHPEYWHKFPPPSVNTYQQSMEVLRELNKPNGKN